LNEAAARQFLLNPALQYGHRYIALLRFNDVLGLVSAQSYGQCPVPQSQAVPWMEASSYRPSPIGVLC